MSIRRILFAVVVSVLTVGCTWAATQAVGTAGFTVIPDSEAAEIVGGDGLVCGGESYWGLEYWPCYANANPPQTPTDCAVGEWYAFIPRWGCVEAASGECYEELMVGYWWGFCQWYPESKECKPDGSAYPQWVFACM